MLIGNWNEVWFILEEGGKSVDVGWYVTTSKLTTNRLVSFSTRLFD